jgi:hypothetical protein
MWPILGADFTSVSKRSHASGANSISGFLGERLGMNTPKSRKPKRYTAPTPSEANDEADYEPGILEPLMAEAMGNILTLWPHVEGHMIFIFRELIGIEDMGNARLVFRSIINQNARISVMKAMLEKSPTHAETSDWFDKIIDEFGALNRIRNTYAHSLWLTHKHTQRIYLNEETDSYEWRGPRREVKVDELVTLLNRVTAFIDSLEEWFVEKGFPPVEAGPPSSQKQSPQSLADAPRGRTPEETLPEREPPPRSSEE